MKCLAVLLLLLPVAAQAAQLCVERLEDEGSVNIYPVTLMLGSREAATLLGGGRKCFSAKTVTQAVWVRWHAFDWNRPDHGLHNRRILHSGLTLLVALNGDQRADLKICSKRVQGGLPFWHVGGDGLGACP